MTESSTHEARETMLRILTKISEGRHTHLDVCELDYLVHWILARLEAYETERDPQ